jgi:hypothetical protein
MISSIFNFKLVKRLRGVLGGLVIVMGVELFVATYYPNRDIFNGYLISSNFGREENPARVVVNTKLKGVARQEADFVLVGESSGFFGVQPHVVNAAMGGRRLINLACCTITKNSGYRHMARYAIERQERIKYLVVHLSAIVFTVEDEGGLAGPIFEGYISPLRHIRDSGLAQYRALAANLVHRREASNQIGLKVLLAGGTGGIEGTSSWYEEMVSNGGWMPIPSKQVPITKEDCDNFLSTGSTGEYREAFDWFKAFADEYQLGVVLAFNPIPCPDISDVNGFGEVVRQFDRENPDVYVPFSPFDYWPSDLFSDPMHLTPDGAALHSERLGRFLASLP